MTIEKLGRHSPRVKELRRRVRDRRPGEVFVDGHRLVADLVRWRVPIRELYLPAEPEPEAKLMSAAERVFLVDGTVLGAIAPTRHPQGVLAVVDEPRHSPWACAGGVGLYLDGVQDPGNLGAIVRCAAALGAAAVWLGAGCADPFHPAAVRGSAGAVLLLPVDRQVELADAVGRIRAAGGEVWAAASSGTPVQRWRPPEPLLLLLGAEGRGLGSDALESADGSVAIPLDRAVESLNVAVAAGILLQHLRQ